MGREARWRERKGEEGRERKGGKGKGPFSPPNPKLKLRPCWAAPVLTLKAKQIHQVNVCWMVIRKIFIIINENQLEH